MKKTMRGLSARALSDADPKVVIAPSQVRERVEALAAWNPALLAELAQEWRPPAEIEGDWFSISAWSVSLRHLKALNAISRDYVDVEALQPEVGLLWDRPAEEEISWRLLVDQCRQRPYSLLLGGIRRKSKCHLVETVLTAQDIVDVHPYMLRLLRGKASVLDDSAREILFSRAKRQFDSDIGISNPLYLELCDELSIDVRSHLWPQAMIRLDEITDPDTIAYAIYSLLGKWQLP